MKKKIIEALKGKKGYLSGEFLSEMLGVSRTAVWKHIKGLQAEGYSIESKPKKGYKLCGVPDKMLPEEMQRLLQGSSFGKNIFYQETVDSTNNHAKKIAEKGAENGTLILAEKQTAGKGRLGRTWESPYGKGIWLSVILRPLISPPDAVKITIAGAVALTDVLRAMGAEAEIKWPNDVLLRGKKVAGILTEIKGDLDEIEYVILGIGVNVNTETFAPELEKTAISLKQELDQKVDRKLLTREFLLLLEKYIKELEKGDFSSLKEKWQKYNIHLHKKVRVKTFKEVIEGKAVGIDDMGMLLLEDEKGKIRKITAGDVSLRW